MRWAAVAVVGGAVVVGGAGGAGVVVVVMVVEGRARTSGGPLGCSRRGTGPAPCEWSIGVV
jgi:hypothetical protein